MKLLSATRFDQRKLMKTLVELQYQRNDQNFYRGLVPGARRSGRAVPEPL